MDLIEAGPKTTFEAVAAALVRCEVQCDRLRAKTSVSAVTVALHQICNLVEFLFTSVLPVPEPWSEELVAAARPGPWIPVAVSLDDQTAVLRAIYRIAVHYVAAAKSVDYDRGTSGKRLVTCGCIVAALDAVLRLQASPMPSPVSAQLHVAAASAPAPAGAAGAGGTGGTSSWVCNLCATASDNSERACGACGRDRGSWACPSCTYVNDPPERRGGGRGPAQCGVCNTRAPGGSSSRDSGPGAAARSLMPRPPVVPGTALPASPPAFELSVCSFAGQSLEQLTESALISAPDVAVARAGVIVYFRGMAAHEATQLFEYDKQFIFDGGDSTLAFVQDVCAVVGVGLDGALPPPNMTLAVPIQIHGEPSETERRVSWLCHTWSACLDASVPEIPELAYARDMIALYKIMLEYDPGQKAISNQVWHTLHASANWRPPEALNGSGRIAARVGLFGRDFEAEGAVPATGNMTNPARFVAGDTQSRDGEREGPTPLNEDDVLHAPSIFNFDNNLTQEDAEKLVSYLTVPYLRIPLVLSFFAEDRLGCLFNSAISLLVERVMFEPRAFFDDRPFTAPGAPILVEAVPLKGKQRAALGTPFGLLVNECLHAPAGIVEPLLEIGHRVVAMCVGDYDASFVDLLLLIVRFASRVEGVLAFVAGTDRLPVTPTAVAAIEELILRLRVFTLRPVRRVLLRYVVAAEAARDVRAAARFHAHHAMLFAHHRAGELDGDSAASLLASSSYVLAWHCQVRSRASAVFFCHLSRARRARRRRNASVSWPRAGMIWMPWKKSVGARGCAVGCGAWMVAVMMPRATPRRTLTAVPRACRSISSSKRCSGSDGTWLRGRPAPLPRRATPCCAKLPECPCVAASWCCGIGSRARYPRCGAHVLWSPATRTSGAWTCTRQSAFPGRRT